MTVPVSFQPDARASRHLDLVGPPFEHHGGLLVAIADTMTGPAAVIDPGPA
jgi:hypothetical protein